MEMPHTQSTPVPLEGTNDNAHFDAPISATCNCRHSDQSAALTRVTLGKLEQFSCMRQKFDFSGSKAIILASGYLAAKNSVAIPMLAPTSTMTFGTMG